MSQNNWREPMEDSEGTHFIGTHELHPSLRKRPPINAKMQAILRTIADAKSGEISGHSIAKWLQMHDRQALVERLRGLVNRGLVTMRPVDDPPRMYPDRMKAMYSVVKESQ